MGKKSPPKKVLGWFKNPQPNFLEAAEPISAQSISTIQTPYQPFAHSLSSPFTHFFYQQYFSPHYVHIDALNAFLVT
jgi:hypothetical protein